MPPGCGKTLLKEWWQRLGLRRGNEDERGGPTTISGQSASNLRIPLLQSATGVRAASFVVMARSNCQDHISPTHHRGSSGAPLSR